MEAILIFLGMMFVIGLVGYFLRKKDEVTIEQAVYYPKSLLTAAEKDFFKTLILLETKGYKVVPQVVLSSIIGKKSTSRYRNELFRVIDFVIFDANYNPKVLIELNDATHQQTARKHRDYKVKTIARMAGLPILFFYTNKPNQPQYIIQRIGEALNAKGEYLK